MDDTLQQAERFHDLLTDCLKHGMPPHDVYEMACMYCLPTKEYFKPTFSTAQVSA